MDRVVYDIPVDHPSTLRWITEINRLPGSSKSIFVNAGGREENDLYRPHGRISNVFKPK